MPSGFPAARPRRSQPSGSSRTIRTTTKWAIRRSKLNHGLRGSGDHRLLWTLYRDLLRLRREVGALARLSREDLEVTADEGQGVLVVRRWSEGDEALAVFHTGDAGASVDLSRGGSGWRKRIDSAEGRWGGSGSPVQVLI